MLRTIFLLLLCISCQEMYEIKREAVAEIFHPECELGEGDAIPDECIENKVVFNANTVCGGSDVQSRGTIQLGKAINPSNCLATFSLSDGLSVPEDQDPLAMCELVGEYYECPYDLSLNSFVEPSTFKGSMTISCENSGKTTFSVNLVELDAIWHVVPGCLPPPPGPIVI